MGKHNILNKKRDDRGELKLTVQKFPYPDKALETARLLESDPSSVNAVYVRADNPNQLRSAYRNYFNDAVDFVRAIRKST